MNTLRRDGSISASSTAGRCVPRSIPILAIFALLGGCANEQTAQPVSTESPTAYSETVETVEATLGVVDPTLIASGTVISPRTTQLSAEVSGRIASIRFDEGDAIRRGETAFVVEAEVYKIDLEEARAGLQLAQAQAAQEVQELVRTKSLMDQQIVARQELDFRKTQVAVAAARVAQAEAQLHRAQRDLERTNVRSPYDATVVERHLHEGANLLGPASVVLTLQALEGFEAELAIPETSATSARAGDPVRLMIQGQTEPIVSSIRSVNPRIDPESRTYSVRALVPPGLGTKSGAFVRAKITPVATRQGVIVPRSSVLRRDGVSYVFRVVDNRAVQTTIAVGVTGLRLAEVIDGLEAGDSVIVGGLIDRLADGSPVTVRGTREPEQQAEALEGTPSMPPSEASP